MISVIIIDMAFQFCKAKIEIGHQEKWATIDKSWTWEKKIKVFYNPSKVTTAN